MKTEFKFSYLLIARDCTGNLNFSQLALRHAFGKISYAQYGNTEFCSNLLYIFSAPLLFTDVILKCF